MTKSLEACQEKNRELHRPTYAHGYPRCDRAVLQWQDEKRSAASVSRCRGSRQIGQPQGKQC